MHINNIGIRTNQNVDIRKNSERWFSDSKWSIHGHLYIDAGVYCLTLANNENTWSRGGSWSSCSSSSDGDLYELTTPTISCVSCVAHTLIVQLLGVVNALRVERAVCTAGCNRYQCSCSTVLGELVRTRYWRKNVNTVMDFNIKTIEDHKLWNLTACWKSRFSRVCDSAAATSRYSSLDSLAFVNFFLSHILLVLGPIKGFNANLSHVSPLYCIEQSMYT